MAKISKQALVAISVSTVLAVSALGLTVVRAPNATVEGYGSSFGIDGEAPGQEFAAALEAFPITVGEQSFTASELGILPAELPTVPRAWSFGDWGRDYPVELKLDSERNSAALAELEGYGAPVDATVAFSESWTVTPGAPGFELTDDLPAAVSKALDAGEKSLNLELQETAPELTTEEAETAASALNSASIEVLGGSNPVATLAGVELASLISLSTEDGTVKLTVDPTAVDSLAAGYGESLAQSRVDGEQVVGDDGTVLKTVTAPRDGFKPGSSQQISEALTGALGSLLETPTARVELPGELDAAKPTTLNRTAVVDISDHWSYFYENGVEVARFPNAVGKPGFETDRGTFKVYAQLPSQNMGSCDSQGNFVRGTSVDYCTANVPWISYFNGDEGFHGTYWHSNFGNPGSNMSHGCVNLSVADAEWSYRFLQVGSTVTVQD